MIKVLEDKKYKNMCRLEWPDGSRSTDMYNQTRAFYYKTLGSVESLPSGETRTVVFAGLEAH